MRQRLLRVALFGLACVSGAVGLYASDLAPADPGLTLPAIDFLLVEKRERRLTAYAAGQPVHIFEHIQLGDAPEGHKHFEGDERTPEGRYIIDYRNAQSSYFLSLRISYPDPAARAHAAAAGRSPGGNIFIHGQPGWLPYGRMEGDWTDGCIALSNEEMEALWDAVPEGTPIEIRP
jgi:murein L,D-transpeptidase YafK